MFLNLMVSALSRHLPRWLLFRSYIETLASYFVSLPLTRAVPATRCHLNLFAQPKFSKVYVRHWMPLKRFISSYFRTVVLSPLLLKLYEYFWISSYSCASSAKDAFSRQAKIIFVCRPVLISRHYLRVLLLSLLIRHLTQTFHWLAFVYGRFHSAFYFTFMGPSACLRIVSRGLVLRRGFVDFCIFSYMCSTQILCRIRDKSYGFFGGFF